MIHKTHRFTPHLRSRARLARTCGLLSLALTGSLGLGCDGLSSSGEGETTAGDGAPPGIPVKCIPSLANGPVDASCGLFVSSSIGSDDNDGSMYEPLATIGRALLSPRHEPIYVCAETFDEALYTESSATVFGGLDCKHGWAWTGTQKTQIAPATDKIPLAGNVQVNLWFEDIFFRAADATANGVSSIAAIVTVESSATFVRCDFEAGNAMDGAPGEPYSTSAMDGVPGNPGGAACTADNVLGGATTQKPCDEENSSEDSVGGRGGSSDEFGGSAGNSGLPLGTMNGGHGEVPGGSYCAWGTNGDAGANGASASADPSISLGVFGGGYGGPQGRDGEKGAPGQGGGGGGGAKGGTGDKKCPVGASGGAGGGSGGTGGCGGKGGKGGQAGGASIGLISYHASLTLRDVNITSKNGGRGGNGGDGQYGGHGAAGGAGGPVGAATQLTPGCSGGHGGDGGQGGRGSGGGGGPSIGIAFAGDAPSTAGVKISIGVGGEGGDGEGPSGKGAIVPSAETMAFPL